MTKNNKRDLLTFLKLKRKQCGTKLNEAESLKLTEATDRLSEVPTGDALGYIAEQLASGAGNPLFAY